MKSLSNDSGDAAIGSIGKTKTLHVQHAFCTFLCHRCTSTRWKWRISRFVEDVNIRQRLPFSWSELRYNPLEFNSRKIRQHLTNWMRWNNHAKVWSSANSLFKWRFCSSRRRCRLSSLLTIRGRPICFITSMSTDWIGGHEVLLPINHNFNKICDI